MGIRFRILCFFAVIFFIINNKVSAQADSLLTIFNKPVIKPGDTLTINFSLVSAKSSLNKATVNCVILNENGFEKKMRWPLLNKMGEVQLVIDRALPAGVYRFFFFVQEGIFQLRGHVVKPSKQSVIKAVLINNKGAITLTEVNVDGNNDFIFKNYIFENYANLIFSDKNSSKKKLDIIIESVLDSAYQPRAVAAAQLLVSNKTHVQFSQEMGISQKDSSLYKGGDYLPEVVVYATKKSVAERYEENYVGGLFKDSDCKVLDVINDPLALSSTDVFEYLQSKVPNMRIKYDKNGDADIVMRNAPVQFYLDEIPIDANYIRSISVADIAIVKFMRAPFIGNPGGNGGAISVYTRRGGDVLSRTFNQYRFRVKGYTPALNKLSVKD